MHVQENYIYTLTISSCTKSQSFAYIICLYSTNLNVKDSTLILPNSSLFKTGIHFSNFYSKFFQDFSGFRIWYFGYYSYFSQIEGVNGTEVLMEKGPGESACIFPVFLKKLED